MKTSMLKMNPNNPRRIQPDKLEKLCEYLYRQSSEACGEYDFVVENMRNYLFKLEVEKQTERKGDHNEI